MTYSTFYPTTPGLKKYSNFNFKAIGRNSVLICTQFLYFYITVCLKLDIGGKFESNNRPGFLNSIISFLEESDDFNLWYLSLRPLGVFNK